jgi:hypothetical protein
VDSGEFDFVWGVDVEVEENLVSACHQQLI